MHQNRKNANIAAVEFVQPSYTGTVRLAHAGKLTRPLQASRSRGCDMLHAIIALSGIGLALRCHLSGYGKGNMVSNTPA